ncbi:MAG: restriction endonuclease subunit S [Clostridia bacterium]|nr:restriction endonuclease subunit S [Clostridia bacterium]
MKIIKIHDIGRTITGTTPSTKEPLNYNSKDIMFIGPSDIKNNRYITDTEKYISTFAFNNLPTRQLSKNSIVIDCIGSDMGNVAITTANCVTNQQINAITNLEDKNVLYFYYLFSTKKHYFHQIGMNGSTMPIISKSLFDDIEILIHDDNEQQHIVNILGSLDEKIESLELITKKLQQKIKFDFIKEYNNLISEKTISIEEFISETIPGDWGKETLEGNYTTMVKCVRGADLPDLKNCNIENAPNRFIINKNYMSKKLQKHDFIVEMSGGSPTQSTGRTAFIPKDFEILSKDLICTNFCKTIRCKNKESAIFCYLLFDMWYDSGLFFNYEIGTTGLKNFNLDAVLGLDIKEPTYKFLHNISNQFELFYTKIIDNSQKIKKLNKLKQLYLKKFFG